MADRSSGRAAVTCNQHWPKPYGRSADSVEQLIIEDALTGLDKPSLGLGEWVVPTLLQHGSASRSSGCCGPASRVRSRWCQLFSEPGAGSDAAAVAHQGHPHRRRLGGQRSEGVDQ